MDTTIIIEFLPTVIMTLLPLLVLFYLTFFWARRSNLPSKISYKVSLIIFCLVLVFLILAINFFVGLYYWCYQESCDFQVGFFIICLIYGSSLLALFGGFLSYLYRNSVEYLNFQKLRAIVLMSVYVIIFGVYLYSIISSFVYDYKTGMIGGISKEEALSIASQELNPGVKTELYYARDKSLYDGKIASFQISYKLLPDTPKECGVFFQEFSISAKDGKVINRLNEYKADFLFLKEGQPAANLTVFVANPIYSSGLIYVLDYGITDQNGKVRLLIWRYQGDPERMTIGERSIRELQEDALGKPLDPDKNNRVYVGYCGDKFIDIGSGKTFYTIDLEKMTDVLAAKKEMPTLVLGCGVLITEVEEAFAQNFPYNLPPEASVEVGDYITILDNKPINNTVDFNEVIANKKSGDILKFQSEKPSINTGISGSIRLFADSETGLATIGLKVEDRNCSSE